MNLPSISYELIILYLLEVGICIGTLGVIFFCNMVYAALSLALVLVLISLLYFLFDADFLAATQILIYVGAINVLILFAIMLISSPKLFTLNFNFTLQSKISAFNCIGLFILLVVTILKTPWSSFQSLYMCNKSNKLDQIGMYLFNKLLLPFELISLLLLIALIGAVLIARRQEYKEKLNTRKLSVLDGNKENFL
nr:subunit 6 of NADH-plastoquinone oxidoreductase [Nitella hyalina]WKT08451.1 subunit 6 of NADH-plastoquinone oxidoreductase [Nitella hyalina]